MNPREGLQAGRLWRASIRFVVPEPDRVLPGLVLELPHPQRDAPASAPSQGNLHRGARVVEAGENVVAARDRDVRVGADGFPVLSFEDVAEPRERGNPRFSAASRPPERALG